MAAGSLLQIDEASISIKPSTTPSASSLLALWLCGLHGAIPTPIHPEPRQARLATTPATNGVKATFIEPARAASLLGRQGDYKAISLRGRISFGAGVGIVGSGCVIAAPCSPARAATAWVGKLASRAPDFAEVAVGAHPGFLLGGEDGAGVHGSQGARSGGALRRCEALGLGLPLAWEASCVASRHGDPRAPNLGGAGGSLQLCGGAHLLCTRTCLCNVLPMHTASVAL